MKIDKKNIIIILILSTLILLVLTILSYSKFFYTPDYNENVKTLLATSENKQCFKDIIKKEYTKEELENTLVKGNSIENVNNTIKIEHIRKINSKKYYSIFKEKEGKLAFVIWEKDKANLICSESKIFYKKTTKDEVLYLIENGYKYDYFKENIEGDYTDPEKTRATLHSHHYTNDGYCVYIEYFDDMEIEPVNVIYIKYDYNCEKEKILNNISAIDLVEMMKNFNCYNTRKIYSKMHGGYEFAMDFYNGLKIDYKNAEEVVPPYVRQCEYLVSLADNEKSFNQLITQKYSKERLLKYNENESRRAEKINYSINRINNENKIECMRELMPKYDHCYYYSILKSTDGLLIIKYQKEPYSFDSEKLLRSTDSWYMDKALYSSDFENLNYEENTMESVKSIDEYGVFFISSEKRAKTLHRTKDGYEIIIEYEWIYDDYKIINFDCHKASDGNIDELSILEKEDFENLRVHINTLTDVLNIDKETAVEKYDFSKYGESIHNTLDGKKIFIKYDYLGGDITDYKNYKINSIKAENAKAEDASLLLDIDRKDIEEYFLLNKVLQ